MINLPNRVAVVGNAQSLFDKSYGKEIDAHDFVIRMNRAAQLYETKKEWNKSHGTKTDMWCVWRWDEYEAIDICLPEYVMTMAFWAETPPSVTGETYVQTVPKNGLMKYPEPFIQHLQRDSGIGNPSTGLMVLDWLSYTPDIEVNVYGFDWKETPTWSDSDRGINTYDFDHQFIKEKQYCLRKFDYNFHT
jgi:hypothetical protein